MPSVTSETYRQFANDFEGAPENTRVLLGQKATTLKEASKNWTIFESDAARIKANKAIVEDFKNKIHQKYGPQVADFAFSMDYAEGDPLTVHLIREVFRKTDEYVAQRLRDRADGVQEKMIVIQNILFEVDKKLESAGAFHQVRFQQENCNPMDMLHKTNLLFLEEKINSTKEFIANVETAIASMSTMIEEKNLLKLKSNSIVLSASPLKQRKTLRLFFPLKVVLKM
ncbi:MAG: hypothetical protein ACOYK6_01595 [Chthoniobacterales bacterium]